MAGRVKCRVTGEYGTSDAFVKIDGGYYKSQEVYDTDRQRRQDRMKLIDYVCREFLGYGDDGQPFSTFLPRKLQELSYYNDALILDTFKAEAGTIHRCLNTMQFKNELNKISYIIGIVRNALPDAMKKREREYQQEVLAAARAKSQQTDISSFKMAPVERKTRDISQWLEEDEL